MMPQLLANLILTFLMEEIARNPSYAVPPEIGTLMVWRVARLRHSTPRSPLGVDTNNYQEHVLDCLKETMEEQVVTKLEPLLAAQQVVLPHRKTAVDLVESMLPGGTQDSLAYLCSGYNNLAEFGTQGAFFEQALAVIPHLL